MTRRSLDDDATMSGLVEAETRAWIECLRCGRYEKATIPIQLPEELAFYATEKVCMTCERCLGHALLYLHRAVRHVH